MLVKRLATPLVALALLGGVAACGSGSEGSPGASSASVNSADAKKFRDLVGLTDNDLKNLEGKEFKIGAVLPLSGPGAVFGKEEESGIALAVDQMRKFMGMQVDYTTKDHKSGDPQAGAQATRELGIAGGGAVIGSYYGVFGSMLKGAQQYKMLTFDPGGGTGNSLKGQDYYWGFRANTPDDGFYSLQYFKETDPSLKKVALVVWDAGDAYVDPIEGHLEQRISENGMEYAGAVLTEIGATDYSVALSKLKDLDPDLVMLVTYGDDTGYFMKQYADSGLKGQVVGPEYVPGAQKIAGAAYDKYIFATDYVDTKNPPNPLTAFFVNSYTDKFGVAPPTFYSPNYYETALAFLQLAARVAADGGDINSGSDLQKALEANPSFASVYGGDTSTPGMLTMDTTTHDPKVRPVGLFRASDFEQLATWNIGGTDFETLGN